jgi:prepilin-type processing-associated H-X9-DG protein
MPRHLGGSTIVYADGHAKWQHQKNLSLDASRPNWYDPSLRFKIPIRPDDDRVK